MLTFAKSIINTSKQKHIKKLRIKKKRNITAIAEAPSPARSLGSFI
jgi:hypothetical protein